MTVISIKDKHKKVEYRDNMRRMKRDFLIMFPPGNEHHFAVKKLGVSHIKNPELQYPD